MAVKRKSHAALKELRAFGLTCPGANIRNPVRASASGGRTPHEERRQHQHPDHFLACTVAFHLLDDDQA